MTGKKTALDNYLFNNLSRGRAHTLSYQPPEDTDRLRALAESGIYRMVVYARDKEGLVSRSRELEVEATGTQIYLPLVVRNS